MKRQTVTPEPIPISWKSASIKKLREDQARDDNAPEPTDLTPRQAAFFRFTDRLKQYARERIRCAIN